MSEHTILPDYYPPYQPYPSFPPHIIGPAVQPDPEFKLTLPENWSVPKTPMEQALALLEPLDPELRDRILLALCVYFGHDLK